MDKQLGFGDCEYAQKRRTTRKERFLAKMEGLVPWDKFLSVIEPHYPKAGKGRRPYPLKTMLRVHLLQQWYALSDPGMEDALYEITPFRLFAELSLDKPIPDESTIMNFRHLLEKHNLGEALFGELNRWLGEAGVMLKEGTLLDATIIEAPTSTKNKDKARDPEMHQTKKGNQWHFGMKAHIGVDSASGMTHHLSTTAANVHDITQSDKLLHGEEEIIIADAGYRGIEKREKHKEREVDWAIVERPSKIKQWKKHPRINKLAIELEHAKSSVRAAVEHPFRIIKCQFGFVKTRYRGLKKNHNQLATLFALANIVRLGQLAAHRA